MFRNLCQVPGYSPKLGHYHQFPRVAAFSNIAYAMSR